MNATWTILSGFGFMYSAFILAFAGVYSRYYYTKRKAFKAWMAGNEYIINPNLKDVLKVPLPRYQIPLIFVYVFIIPFIFAVTVHGIYDWGVALNFVLVMFNILAFRNMLKDFVTRMYKIAKLRKVVNKVYGDYSDIGLDVNKVIDDKMKSYSIVEFLTLSVTLEGMSHIQNKMTGLIQAAPSANALREFARLQKYFDQFIKESKICEAYMEASRD